MTRHDSNVLHGVTSLVQGTRESLFVLDFSNNLGERDVVSVTEDDLILFEDQHREGCHPNILK